MFEFFPFGSKHGYDGTIEQLEREPELVLLQRAPLYVLFRNSILVCIGVLKAMFRRD